MSYAELLMDEKWQEKRQGIIKRDNNCCQKCNNISQLPELEYGVFHSVNTTKKTINALVRRAVTLVEFRCPESILKDNFKNHIFYFYRLNGFKIMVGIREMTFNEVNVFGESIHYSDIIKAIVQPSNNVPMDILSNEEYDSRYERLSEVVKKLNSSQHIWKYFKGLHVHHTYYQHNKMPWEYPDESLQTLCINCHIQLHKEQTIPVLDENGVNIGEYHYCDRCSGAGWFPQYLHVEEGICFKCKGARYVELIGK